MKDDRVEKLERCLFELEEALRSSLLQDLPDAAESGLDLFRLEWNPRRAHIEWLMATAKQVTELRLELMMETQGGVGRLYLDCVDESRNVDNPHRRGPRKLARHLLKALKGV